MKEGRKTSAEADHLTPSEVKKYRETGAHHRPVECRACHEVRASVRSFVCSACPVHRDGSKPEFTDGGHLSKDQKKNVVKRGTSVVCGTCYKAGRTPRKTPTKRAPEEEKNAGSGKRRKLVGL